MKIYLQIFLKFLHFGFLAWGGPVAQIGMIRDELVEKEKWIERDKFKRVLAVYQALPGPEAHEMCVYMGMIRAGRIGGFLAGLGFMLPGFLFILILSYAYMQLGAAIIVAFFVGVKPAVAAIIARALHRIGSHVLHSKSLFFTGLVSVLLTLVNIHFLIVFIICGTGQAIWVKGYRKAAVTLLMILTIIALGYGIINYGTDEIKTEITIKQTGFFTEGLKAGMLSFGGAYTVIPFLKDGMVDKFPRISESVFLDGIAISNIIPAPLVIFGSFLGFVSGGLFGAALMTIGIFLPAFFFTLIGHKWLERAIEHKPLHGFLDGVSASVVGLLAVTTFSILIQSVTDIKTGILFSLSIIALYLLKAKWTIPTIVIISAIAGRII